MPDSDTPESEVCRHTRELDSAYEFMDLSEHATWMLGEAVDAVDYPAEVTITIEATEQEEETIEKHAEHDTDVYDGFEVCKDCKTVIDYV